MSQQITIDNNDIYCPILKCIFNDPVIAGDGHTYEREAIQKWLEENGTSPITREYIEPIYYSNMFMKNIVDQVLFNNPDLKCEQYVLTICITDIVNSIHNNMFDINRITNVIIKGFENIEWSKEMNILLDHPNILEIVKKINLDEFDIQIKHEIIDGRVIDWFIDECKNIDAVIYIIENTNYDIHENKTLLTGLIAVDAKIDKKIAECFLHKYSGINMTKRIIQNGNNIGDYIFGELCMRKDGHEIIDKILSENKDILKNNKNLSLSLYLTCSFGSIENIKVLQKYGACTNLVKYKGNTCIMAACKNSNIEVIQYLLGNVSNIMEKDKKGKSILYYIANISDNNYDLYKKIIDKYHRELVDK